jgi:hypothetical protein
LVIDEGPEVEVFGGINDESFLSDFVTSSSSGGELSSAAGRASLGSFSFRTSYHLLKAETSSGLIGTDGIS